MRMKKMRVSALLTALMLLMLTACNNAETPEQAIKFFNNEMNNCDYKAAFNYVSEYDGLKFDSGDKDGTKMIVDAVAKTLEMEIISIDTSGATGVATLNITTVDLREIYSNAAAVVTQNYVDTVLGGAKISAEQMREALVEEISREAALSDSKKVTTECKINLTKEKDKWYLILDSESFNIVMGYINEANAMVESGEFSSIVSDSDIQSEDTSSEAVSSDAGSGTAVG